jgi:hypothetical protein
MDFNVIAIWAIVDDVSETNLYPFDLVFRISLALTDNLGFIFARIFF